MKRRVTVSMGERILTARRPFDSQLRGGLVTFWLVPGCKRLRSGGLLITGGTPVDWGEGGLGLARASS